MNKIYTQINAATNGKYAALRFSCVELNGKTAKITIVCKPEMREFVAKNRAELNGMIADICEFHAQIETVINDELPTEGSMRAAVVGFTEKFGYISSVLHTITVKENNGEFTVSLKMHEAMYRLAEKDYIPRLKEFLENSYADEVKIDVASVGFAQSGSAYAPISSEVKEYTLNGVVPVIGENTPLKAMSPSSITANAYNVTVCGVLVMPTVFTSKGGSRYERFLLYDGENPIQCRMSLSGGIKPLGPEYINKTVCVFGNAEYDSMRHEASISVREVALCEVDGLTAIKNRPAPKTYDRVKPTAYIEYVQSSMFDIQTELPETLKGSFVVFDFETTGLSLVYDRPTELGAVKIVDGQITECFSTLIDPRREIPEEVVIKTGITNDMVKGQPLFEDVIPDFYKFTENCGLVCHNIAFDFPILIKGGNRCGYAFGDRKTYDTMALAPLALPGIQKLSLDKILEGLGLVNDSAHRAWADAAATAKAFVAMNKMLAKK